MLLLFFGSPGGGSGGSPVGLLLSIIGSSSGGSTNGSPLGLLLSLTYGSGGGTGELPHCLPFHATVGMLKSF